jgi:hypothetical protein
MNGREVIFFSSNRVDGFGGYDLWYLSLEEPGMLPENLGEPVNSPGNEVTPFYRKTEDQLYFASDWHYGMGGFDLFVSSRSGEKFGYPENLKPPFNTPANDLYYSFEPRINKGSLTSNREGRKGKESRCCNDLWLFSEAEIREMDTLPEIANLEDLNKYLPVRLYFHNDEPNPKTRQEKTDLNYLETYRAYTALLPEYERTYSSGLQGLEKKDAEDAMDSFFIDKVDQGVKDLELFARLLQQELEEGARIELTVKGFASPLAATDYNVNLTKRRISSLVNYLKRYESGSLRPYMEGNSENDGLLRIVEIPFGEYVADEMVSDNPNESNAIYSIAAAMERKIEIVSVSRAREDTMAAMVHFDSEIIDLGRLPVGSTANFKFSFEVEEGNELRIDSLKYDTTFISLDSVPKSFTSLGTHVISGTISPGNSEGKKNFQILIHGNFPGRKKELNITFELLKP